MKSTISHTSTMKRFHESLVDREAKNVLFDMANASSKKITINFLTRILSNEIIKFHPEIESKYKIKSQEPAREWWKRIEDGFWNDDEFLSLIFPFLEKGVAGDGPIRIYDTDNTEDPIFHKHIASIVKAPEGMHGFIEKMPRYEKRNNIIFSNGFEPGNIEMFYWEEPDNLYWLPKEGTVPPQIWSRLATGQDAGFYTIAGKNGILVDLTPKMQMALVKHDPSLLLKIQNPRPQVQMAALEQNPRLFVDLDNPDPEVIEKFGHLGRLSDTGVI